MKQERCIILIDGSNFYFKLKSLSLSNLLDFDFSAFARTLTRDRQIVSARYYVGAVRTDGTERTQRMYNNQRRLFAHLKKHNVAYSLGYLLKSDGAYHEKGVDVNIAVDMLIATYEDQCDHLYLLSSDTDLIPAIQQARKKGKAVTYVGFSHQASVALVASCTESRLFAKDDLAPFIKPQQAESAA